MECSRLLTLDPSLGLIRTGFPIADQIEGWNPANVYVTCHESGNDNAVYVADGSTGWYRVNPTQAPDGGSVWSPKANIVGGCKVVQSIEVTKGVHKLLIGATTGGQTISKRDLTVSCAARTACGTRFHYLRFRPHWNQRAHGEIRLIRRAEVREHRQVTLRYCLPAGRGTDE